MFNNVLERKSFKFQLILWQKVYPLSHRFCAIHKAHNKIFTSDALTNLINCVDYYYSLSTY